MKAVFRPANTGPALRFLVYEKAGCLFQSETAPRLSSVMVMMMVMMVTVSGKSCRSSHRNQEKCDNQNLFHVPNPSMIFRPVEHPKYAASKLQMGHKRAVNKYRPAADFFV